MSTEDSRDFRDEKASQSDDDSPLKTESEGNDDEIQHADAEQHRPGEVERVPSKLDRVEELHPVRSHRSYGCGDGYTCFEVDEEHASTRRGAAAQDEEEKFEVGWEGGPDEDPESPRKLGTFRRWVIVLIIAGSSLCVYVGLNPSIDMHQTCPENRYLTEVYW